MSYATINDMKKMFEKAILQDKYHIVITIENEGVFESFTYKQGVSDKEVPFTKEEMSECIDEVKELILTNFDLLKEMRILRIELQKADFNRFSHEELLKEIHQFREDFNQENEKMKMLAKWDI